MPSVLDVPLLDCPPQELVLRFHTGAISDDDFERVAEHVSSCEKCMATLIRLQASPPSDPLLKALRRSYRADFTLNEAEERLAGTARKLRPGTPFTPAKKIDRGLLTIKEKDFGPYELESVLGHGGMGVVYKARQKRLNRYVAIKTILAGQHAGPSVRDRFKIEGEAVARLKHPRVVQIFEFDDHDGIPYFSMELAEGGSLKELIKKGPIAPRRAAEMLAAIADGVEYAHQQKVLHRDLKPGNILLDASGDPKITDFGLAKFLDIDTGSTRTEVILGTPSYMAPEQASDNRKQVDQRTDVYSLGAILYEMLTGEAPFKGDTRSEILQQVRKAEPEPPSSKITYIPHVLELICLKCLEKSPDRRYASAALLAQDLRDHLASRPTVAAAHEWRSKARKQIKKHAAKVAVGLAIFLALGAAWYYDPERAREQIEAKLAQGQSLSLVTKSGKVHWYNWRLGGDRATLLQGYDGTVTVESREGLALLELVNMPALKSYRLSAEVAQEKGAQSGSVGIFSCALDYPTTFGLGHAFLALKYNDFAEHFIPMKPVEATLPPEVIRKSRERLDPAILDCRIVVMNGDQFVIDTHPLYIQRPMFVAAGGDRGPWRRLELIVTPERVGAWWNGQELGFLGPQELRDGSDAVNRGNRALNPKGGGFEVNREIRLNGSLGFFVERGAAIFRNVKIDPI